MLHCRWIEGDATKLPFSDCSFDAITMGYGLRNVLDRGKAMQEMFRVLKPGSLSTITLFCSCESVEIRDLVKLVLLFDWICHFFLKISGSRVSILDFNKSTKPSITSIQVLLR